MSEELLKRISEIVRRKTGFDISQYKDDFIERQIKKITDRLQITIPDYMRNLENDWMELENFLENLTVYHTKFFRDAGKYEAFRKYVLKEVLKRCGAKKTLSIWSAGCAAGEEPYSLAIVLSQELKERIREWKIRFLATDMNGELLQRAMSGIYSEKQVEKSEMDKKIIRDYFFLCDQDENDAGEKFYKISPEIRSLVHFEMHNLIQDPFPESLDIIFCRNVLIYVKYEFMSGILNRFYESLNKEGVLVLGNFESLDSSFITRFEKIKLSGEYFYKKIDTGSALHDKMVQKEKYVHAGLGLRKL